MKWVITRSVWMLIKYWLPWMLIVGRSASALGVQDSMEFYQYLWMWTYSQKLIRQCLVKLAYWPVIMDHRISIAETSSLAEKLSIQNVTE